MGRRTQVVSSNLERLCSVLVGTKLESKILSLQKQGGCPLIEDIEGDSENKRVTFFYIGDGSEGENVRICSYSFASLLLDPEEISCSPKEKLLPVMPIPKFPMEKLKGTNIWVLSRDVPKEARFSYSIEAQPGTSRIYDPLNSLSFGPPDDESRLDSFLDLSSLEIEAQTTPMSDIISEHRIKRYSISDVGVLTNRTEEEGYQPKKDERILTVHFPEEPLDPSKTYPMRLFLDGKGYLEDFEVPTILDDGTINMMLEPKEIHGDAMKDRDYDYRFDQQGDGFSKFLVESFIPSVQQEFHVSSHASDLTICGSSLSGFAAMYIGLYHPKVFGNVLTQSAALWLDAEGLGGRLLELLESGSLQNSCFYLETSKIEAASIFSANHRFDEIMTQQGITHIFEKTCGEHGPAAWSQFLQGAVCSLQERRADMHSPLKGMSFVKFDQTPGQGWRVLADNKQFQQAAELIKKYFSVNPDISGSFLPSERCLLWFHAGQMFAMAGNKSDASAAFLMANQEPGALNEALGNNANAYMRATIAFLSNDRASVESAFDEIDMDVSQCPRGSNLIFIPGRVHDMINQMGASYNDIFEMSPSLPPTAYNALWERVSHENVWSDTPEGYEIRGRHNFPGNFRMPKDVEFPLKSGEQGEDSTFLVQLCQP